MMEAGGDNIASLSILNQDYQHQEVNQILQGEVARLDSQRFKIEMDLNLQPIGAQSFYLTCWLNDPSLPHVPQVLIKVPPEYPKTPPHVIIDPELFSTSNFLSSAKQNFEANLQKLPQNFSLTSLLLMWEKSVRQSCHEAKNGSGFRLNDGFNDYNLLDYSDDGMICFSNIYDDDDTSDREPFHLISKPSYPVDTQSTQSTSLNGSANPRSAPRVSLPS